MSSYNPFLDLPSESFRRDFPIQILGNGIQIWRYTCSLGIEFLNLGLAPLHHKMLGVTKLLQTPRNCTDSYMNKFLWNSERDISNANLHLYRDTRRLLPTKGCVIKRKKLPKYEGAIRCLTISRPVYCFLWSSHCFWKVQTCWLRIFQNCHPLLCSLVYLFVNFYVLIYFCIHLFYLHKICSYS